MVDETSGHESGKTAQAGGLTEKHRQELRFIPLVITTPQLPVNHVITQCVRVQGCICHGCVPHSIHSMLFLHFLLHECETTADKGPSPDHHHCTQSTTAVPELRDYCRIGSSGIGAWSASTSGCSNACWTPPPLPPVLRFLNPWWVKKYSATSFATGVSRLRMRGFSLRGKYDVTRQVLVGRYRNAVN